MPLPSRTPDPSPTCTAVSGPGAEGQGPLVVSRHCADPNPVWGGSGHVDVDLEGAADRVELRLYSAGMTVVKREVLTGNYGPGWNRLDLDLRGLARGLYYYQVVAQRDGGVHSAPVLGRLVLLR